MAEEITTSTEPNSNQSTKLGRFGLCLLFMPMVFVCANGFWQGLVSSSSDLGTIPEWDELGLLTGIAPLLSGLSLWLSIGLHWDYPKSRGNISACNNPFDALIHMFYALATFYTMQGVMYVLYLFGALIGYAIFHGKVM